MKPVDSENATAVSAPAMPPSPTTEPTACGGNRSEASANRLAAQPWWALAAIPINTVASHKWEAWAVNTTGMTHSAQASMAVLRLAFSDQPRWSKADDSQPPPMLPKQVME